MDKLTVRLKQLVDGCAPTQSRESDAGWDLRCACNGWLYPGKSARVPTGIAMAIPSDHFGLVCARSSTSSRAIEVAGVVDSEYRGQVYVIATNVGEDPISFSKGDRLAQVIILPRPSVKFEWSSELDATERGAKAFGSSGGTVGNAK